MSVIRKSADLEVIVLRIFEDFQKAGGDFHIISPWINNFSFTEAIITSFQIRIFGSAPSLHAILKRCSESHKGKPLNITSHNFGIRPDFSQDDLEDELQGFGINLGNYELILEGEVERAFALYRALFRKYREYSKFNDPWLSSVFRDFQWLIDYVGTYENYQNAISDVVQSVQQTSINIRYLNDLRKFLGIRNVNVGLHGNFHAKIFLAGSSAVTGSSNWTFSGFVKNDEINLFISGIDSPGEFKKIKERCHEIEREACFITLENVTFLTSLHRVLGVVYIRLFDWLTDNKNSLTKK